MKNKDIIRLIKLQEEYNNLQNDFTNKFIYSDTDVLLLEKSGE